MPSISTGMSTLDPVEPGNPEDIEPIESTHQVGDGKGEIP
jgi:hypothetical protein